jgi:cell division protein FtsB
MTTPSTLPSTSDGADRRNLRLIIFVLIGLCLLFVVGYLQRLAEKEAVAAQMVAMQTRIADAERRTAILQDQLADVNSSAYVAQVARDHLGLIQENDRPIVVLDPPATAVPALEEVERVGQGTPPAETNWRLWWELVVPPARAERR